MDAKELRIGNWVYDIRGEQDIKCNLQFMKQEDRLYPIPLTEEILLKCGFSHVNNVYKLKFDNFLTICIDEEDYSVCLYDNERNFEKGDYPCLSKNTNYLHQLQNIYFALTGEELNVEL